jgi:hypothetical protein
MKLADDWRETGKELLKVMKSGRNIVLAEITSSPELRTKTGLDIHIEYVFEKLFSRIGWELGQFPYYSPEQLQNAFAGLVVDSGVFAWEGIELFGGKNDGAGQREPRTGRNKVGVRRAWG